MNSTAEITNKPAFVAPHHINALGEEGLTAHEIADSLNADFQTVVRKLERGWANLANTAESFKVPNGYLNNINGLEFKEYFLNTKAAKAFVAQYQSVIGFSYLAFLLNCEAAVEQLAKKLMQAEQKIHALESAKPQKQLKAPKRVNNFVPKTANSLFDDNNSGARRELCYPHELSLVDHANSIIYGACLQIIGLDKTIKNAFRLKDIAKLPVEERSNYMTKELEKYMRKHDLGLCV